MKKGDIVSINGKQATIKWVVDVEIGVLYDSGEQEVVDTSTTAVQLLSESAPVYQTSVDHMTDDQLRASIEELRNRRSTYVKVGRVSTPKEPPVSVEDMKLASVLRSKTPEEILELKRKLGLID